MIRHLSLFTLYSLLFTLFLCSCSTHRITTTDYVHDTLYVSHVLHDSIVKEVVRFDTLIQIKTVEVETTIRQDSAGNELSRNTNRTVNNDTYHGCGVTDKDYQLMLKQDSIASSKSKETQKVSEKVKSDNWFTHLWKEILQILGIMLVLVIGYIIGVYRQKLINIFNR